jgi:hypothetical protein
MAAPTSRETCLLFFPCGFILRGSPTSTSAWQRHRGFPEQKLILLSRSHSWVCITPGSMSVALGHLPVISRVIRLHGLNGADRSEVAETCSQRTFLNPLNIRPEHCQPSLIIETMPFDQQPSLGGRLRVGGAACGRPMGPELVWGGRSHTSEENMEAVCQDTPFRSRPRMTAGRGRSAGGMWGA